MNSFKAIVQINKGCVLQYNSTYEKILIQYKLNILHHEEWKDLLESSTDTQVHGDTTEVEVNNLIVNNTYIFRGLFEDDKGEIILLTSEVTIKGEKFNFLLICFFLIKFLTFVIDIKFTKIYKNL